VSTLSHGPRAGLQFPPTAHWTPDRRPHLPRGQAGRPVCRVGMSPLSRTKEPARHPRSDPERLSSGLPFHGRPLQSRSPGIGRDVASTPVRESATLDTRTVSEVTTPPQRPKSSPTVPAADFCRNPDDGICRQKTSVPSQRPCSSPSEEPQAECSRILPPVAPNASLSSTPTAQHLSACPLQYPAAARRRALAVMLHEHHREPDKLDAPARCAGTTSLS